MSKDRNYLFYGGPWDGEWKRTNGAYIIRVPIPRPHSHDASHELHHICTEPTFDEGEYQRSGAFGDYYQWVTPKRKPTFPHHHGEITIKVECDHGRTTTCGHAKTTITVDCAR